MKTRQHRAGPVLETAIHLLALLLPGFCPAARLLHSTGPAFRCTQLTLKKRSARCPHGLSWQLRGQLPAWGGGRPGLTGRTAMPHSGGPRGKGTLSLPQRRRPDLRTVEWKRRVCLKVSFTFIGSEFVGVMWIPRAMRTRKARAPGGLPARHPHEAVSSRQKAGPAFPSSCSDPRTNVGKLPPGLALGQPGHAPPSQPTSRAASLLPRRLQGPALGTLVCIQ